MSVAIEHAGGGPFYFAWVDSDETTFAPEHERYDEYIFSFERKLSEGQLPTLTIEMKNPGALLSPGRKVWAWLAKNTGTDVVPLFFGRIVGIPTDILAEVITVQFTAKPLDYLDRKQAAAAPLKVLPFYDRVFIDPAHRDDPDTVLEGYSKLWDVNPVTHVVTASDVLVGEDGTEIIGTSDAFRDSLKITIGQAPLKAVKVEASVGWTQSASGSFLVDTPNFTTFDGASIVSGWPKIGADFGGGYKVLDATAVDAARVDEVEMATYEFKFKDESKVHRNGDLLSHDVSETKPLFFGGFVTVETTSNVSNTVGDPDTGKAASTSVQTTNTYAAISVVGTSLTLAYEAARERHESIVFTLGADFQPILTESDETQDTDTITLSGADVGVEIDGVAPIGDLSRRAYFTTDRGLNSLEYALAVGRAHLLARSRSVNISNDIQFDRAIDVTCRKNAQFTDDRIPGGEAIGKVIETLLKGNGDNGEFFGTITAGCAIGFGGSFSEVEGEPSYVDDDYVEDDYQIHEGQIIALPSSDVGYAPPTDGPNDDGLVFPLIPSAAIVSNGFTANPDQEPAVVAAARPNGFVTGISPQELAAKAQKAHWDQAIKDSKITYRLELKPVNNGPFNTEYDVTAGPVVVPKMIDLQAA